ncbi:MAG: hypothetical protein HYT87_10380 [Nitrospirae bacterium]|nr:hypothetical protein [Nitrospirota bacterium]
MTGFFWIWLIAALAFARVGRAEPASDAPTPPSASLHITLFVSPAVRSDSIDLVNAKLGARGFRIDSLQPFSARLLNGVLYKEPYEKEAREISRILGAFPMARVEDTAAFDVAVDLSEDIAFTPASDLEADLRQPFRNLEASVGMLDRRLSMLETKLNAMLDRIPPPAPPNAQAESATEPPKEASRKGLRATAYGAVLSPGGRIGQTFGQMFGGGAALGYAWSNPWAVELNTDYYTGSVSVIDLRSNEPTEGRLSLMPIGLTLLHETGHARAVRPFFGAGPVIEVVSLSNAATIEGTQAGGETALAFGYAVRGGASISIGRRAVMRAELAWLAPEGTLADSREGSGIRFSLGVGL